MNTYNDWALRHPLAAADLQAMFTAQVQPPDSTAEGKSEAWSQQRARLKAAHAGAGAWRNNVGATPAKCPACGEKSQPVRYGLANDSAKLNAVVKSSDLILAIPRLITPAMVGTTIAQFGSVESKRPGWAYTGTEREQAQLAWLAIVRKLGGFATFSTGELEL
jgi:hypothetical protein